ncbi:Fe3+ ABC transporter periplasmic protein [Oleiphilus messinensis]|uniref:Fe3+ ABC transporter periplasmic protein n=1 Tax=Oleiphilus messinensis TaxID=141451 RepID=A0A1Y0I9C3_9GAMM|nr:Fe(3+) ABC transporter substrate-binding protein [Oleiphilus messinensis]ARU57117.1 Fe3+ ABC transporter periplasmic protein [Oleiphilus messinensis]
MKAKLVWLLGALSIAASSVTSASEEVNVYSLRQPFLMKPLFDTFTRETGVKVNVVFAKKGLAERLKREGRNSPADLILTTDLGNLAQVQQADVIQPVKSKTLNDNIPSQYRDPDGKWYALTTRVRAIYTSKDRIKEGAINSYEDLANPEWKGKICTRSGKHPYNIALIASMITHHGEAEAEKWLRAVKGNLARKPQGNDRAQVKAVKEGVCDVALGNSYYYGKMLMDEEQSEWAASVNINFPNQQDRGAHVNISGVAMTKSAPNRDNALKLMEFLSNTLAQRIYSEQNFEYPVNANVQPSGLVASWGEFKSDKIPLAEIEKHRETAVKMVDTVDFDG